MNETLKINMAHKLALLTQDVKRAQSALDADDVEALHKALERASDKIAWHMQRLGPIRKGVTQ